MRSSFFGESREYPIFRLFSLARVEAAGATSPTQQQTRRGRHYLYRHPGCDTRNRRSVGGRAVDVRGDGGYVVAYDDAGSWTSDDIESAPVYREPQL